MYRKRNNNSRKSIATNHKTEIEYNFKNLYQSNSYSKNNTQLMQALKKNFRKNDENMMKINKAI